MAIDFCNIDAGSRALVFDIVNENKCWFVERGLRPLEKTITLVNFSMHS